MVHKSKLGKTTANYIVMRLRFYKVKLACTFLIGGTIPNNLATCEYLLSVFAIPNGEAKTETVADYALDYMAR